MSDAKNSSDMSDIKRLVAARGNAKGSITRTALYIDEKGDTLPLEQLEVKKDRLMQVFKEYETCHVEVQLLNADDEEDFASTEDKYCAVLAKLNMLIKARTASSTSAPPCIQVKPETVEQSTHAYTRLPSIQLPVFDGDIAQFQPFQDLFMSTIHNHPKLSDVEKLYYLRTHLTGEALGLIANLPLTNENYHEAFSLVRERYDNKVRIISHHINLILDFPSIVRGTAVALRTLLCQVNQNIRALANLKEPIDKWDSILTCILLKKLDSVTSKAYYLEKKQSTNFELSSLLNFLEIRASALEDLGEQRPARVTALVSQNKTRTITCDFCSSDAHRLYACPKFKMAPANNRVTFVKTNCLCTTCLNSHKGKCRYHFRCATCKESHNTLLHVDQEVIPEKINCVSNLAAKNVLLPTVKVMLPGRNGGKITVRALLDCGSQTSCISKNLCTKISGEMSHEKIDIIGIGQNANSVNSSIKLNVYSCISEYSVSVDCCVVDKITGMLPQYAFDTSTFNVPSHVRLADDNYNSPDNLELLLGADIFFQVLLNGRYLASSAGTYVQNTQFGYVVGGNLPSGPVSRSDRKPLLTNHACIQPSTLDSTLQRFWECEKVPEIYTESSSEQSIAEQIFQGSVQLNDNKFTVTLPLKQSFDKVDLGDSFTPAYQRFINLEKRFKKQPNIYDQYKRFIDEYIELDHAEYVDISKYDLSSGRVCFLAHHPVLREDSKTTKLRVVFDGGLKSLQGVSLNDILLNGPVVQNSLFNILLLFRLNKYILTCDVKKMFRCININSEQHSLQNILWRSSPDMPIQCICLKTVTYGQKSSSFLATRCLVELANMYGNEFPIGSLTIQHNCYVDDVLSGADTIAETKELKSQLISLLERGGFSLHKWGSNDAQILDDIPNNLQQLDDLELGKDSPCFKTLGMTFDVKADCFKLVSSQKETKTVNTKRQVLSCISQFYDPLGLMGPVFVKAKCILQKLWLNSLGWDAQMPYELNLSCNTFIENLKNMPPINIMRYIYTLDASIVEIVGFGDASTLAYGASLYLRVLRNNGQVTMNLLCSKSRISPAHKVLTIPKLELNAALLLAKLVSSVHKALSLKINPKVILYSDSQIVLSWLQANATTLKTYVGNRIKQIQELTADYQWCFISSENNPSDILSRGTDPQLLASNSQWWHGPAHMLNADYVHTQYKNNNSVNLPELKVNVCSTVELNDNKLAVFEKLSDVNKLKRVIAYVFRFYHNCKEKSDQRFSNLTANELEDALTVIIRYDQHQHFHEDIKLLKNNKPLKGALSSLHPFLDSKDVLRVGGRLHQADLPFYTKHPIILSKNSDTTRKIIWNEHIKLLHAGAKLVQASLSQYYWIVNAGSQVKKVLFKCVKCAKLKAHAAKQLMGSLPAERITPARVFQIVGVDFCGPFLTKQGRIRSTIKTKSYVAIFVCFTTKSVHIELVSSLTTESFLACFKRFISRRNLPTQVFCDNAATFKGANNELQELYHLQSSKDHQDRVIDFSANQGVHFEFIPSYSPVFGGLWEAGVKSIKYHMKRVIGVATLTYEELNTVLVQIESVLNSRPLTPMSSDPTDLSYLTAGHFLTGAPMNSYPEQNLLAVPTNRLTFWNQCTQIYQSFWKVWSKSYLVQLQSRPKWKNDQPNITVGTLVILVEDNTPPLYWPMGRVTMTIPGRDGKVRVLEVKTQKGTYRRSITRVCVLPIDT